jgi:sugar lactone lactonase YvrE
MEDAPLFRRKNSREETVEIRAIVDCRTTLGEGPLWDVREQKIYWVDSIGCKIYRADADGTNVETWDVPSKIGSLALREKGGAIIALQSGIHTFDFTTGRATPITDPEPDHPTTRLNDGKVDRRGRFFFGSMDIDENKNICKLYRLDPDLSLHVMDDGIIVSNGPCFSPDDRTFYFADSRSGYISAYDYDVATGSLSNKRTFVEFASGAPDGGTVDAEGYVWSAAIIAGELRRFAPDGTLERAIPMPVKNLTSLNFGGPNLDVIYCTSIAKMHLPDVPNDGPLGGSLFAIYGAGIRGVPEPRFAG